MKYLIRKILFSIFILPCAVYTFWQFTFDDGSLRSFLITYLIAFLLILLLPTLEQMKQKEYDEAEKIFVANGHLKITERHQLRDCIDLRSIKEIKAKVEDLSPYELNFMWVLSCDNGRDIVFSNAAQGVESFVKAFSQFDGVDDKAYSAALTCETNKTFVLWRRSK